MRKLASNLEIDLSEILEEYNDEVKEIVEEAIDEQAKETIKELKATSPRRRPKYYKGWGKKGKGKEVIIHNRTLPSLTHILEKGYATNGRRYPAQPHIKPAEENAKKGLEAKIRSKL